MGDFNESIDILKSENVSYAFGSSSVTFKKKGKELKEKAMIKKAVLEDRKKDAKKEMISLKGKLEGHGIKFLESEDGYYRPTYAYNDERLKGPSSVEGKTIYQCIQEYNTLMYKCQHLKAEIEALQILEENFEDNKSYDVTMRQLQSLEKSGDIDIEKGRRDPVGTIRDGRKKVAEGKWVAVKEGGKEKKKESDGGGSERKQKLKAAHAKMDVARDKIAAAERKIEYHQGSKEKAAHAADLKKEKINLKEANRELNAAINEARKYIVKKSFEESIDILKSENGDI